MSSFPSVSPTLKPRRKPHFSGNSPPDFSKSTSFSGNLCLKLAASALYGSTRGTSSVILKFPSDSPRQLNTKPYRKCGNIGTVQLVAASWSNNDDHPPSPSAAVGGGGSGPFGEEILSTVVNSDGNGNVNGVKLSDSKSTAAFLTSDGSIAIHAGERLGRGIVTDGITTPVVNTSAYFFKNTAELIDFKEGCYSSFEYGRYGNPTTVVAEKKISALEGAESTLLMASGMCASTILLMALVPAGGHIVTTRDCYRKTRIFIETVLPKMGIKLLVLTSALVPNKRATVIHPADVDALGSALEKNDVALFFTESPTNPFLRCVDIKLVCELCHRKGALVCVDGTFATPLNQKPLALGADIVLHSATKYIGGHNDVIAGCVSGSEKLVAQVRTLHNIIGGTLSPMASYLIIRGMKTLHLRVQQQNSTALRMAKLLEDHPKVKRVYYPGLSSHPEHQLAKKQMTGYGGVVSFEIDGDLFTTAKFIDALKIPYIAPSFGGCESIVDQPAIMSYWDLSREERARFGIADNLIRFSFGVEDFDDLKDDILHALETI